MSTLCKSLDACIEKADVAGFDARFILSAATPDRVKDTIDPAAYDGVASKTDRLVALFNHNPDNIVGYWAKFQRASDTLTALIKFSSVPLGQMIKTLIDEGVPLATSIGFKGAGAANKAGGYHFTTIDLLETSIVSVPAHPRAQQIAKQFGISLPSSAERVPSAMSGSNAVVINAKAAILHANRARNLK